MKRLTMLLHCLLTELGDQCSTCTRRDWSYIQSRIKHEGISFLTITLPEFASALEQALELGRAVPSLWPSFGHNRRSCLPRFLSGFTAQVFDVDGSILKDASPDAIFAIRQISYLCKKVRLECSDAAKTRALQSYLRNEESLRALDNHIRFTKDFFLDAAATTLVSHAFHSVDSECLDCDHGPGATAEHLRSNERRTFRQWPERSTDSFPLEVFAVPNPGYYKNLERIRLLGVRDEPAVRVVFVPKTLKSPRVIAVEPSHMQYMQQGVLKYMVSRLQAHPLTRDAVRFSDQQPNRDAAESASRTLRFSTLDLKDASDLVSLALVQRIFRGSRILHLLEDCRSLHADLPDGTSVVLRKFASMGSAVCFPVEAFVFYVLIVAAVAEHLGRSPTPRFIHKFVAGRVWVYGDDIIVPSEWHASVVNKLEAYGLKVNRHKSFSVSHFRESCGGDFYKGYPVRPVYLREIIPDVNRRWPPKAIASLTASSNWFYRLGLWSTSRMLREFIEHACGRSFPLSRDEADGLTFYSCMFDTYQRWNPALHRFERKVLKVKPLRVEDDVRDDEVAAMTLGLRNIGNPSSVDLSTSVRSQSLRVKTGWSW